MINSQKIQALNLHIGGCYTLTVTFWPLRSLTSLPLTGTGWEKKTSREKEIEKIIYLKYISNNQSLHKI